MKKYLLGCAFSLGIIFSANAQKHNLSFGPTAGFGHSWITGKENSHFKPAGNAGVALTYSAQEHWGFGGEVKYSWEGNQVEQSASNKVTWDLNYVRVPLKAYYFFGDYGQRVRPKLGFGPSFGFLTSAKEENSNNAPEKDIKSMIKDFDFGGTASFGINYRLVSNTWLVVDAAYYHGFSNIIEPNTVTGNFKNKNLGLNVGVNFGIGNAK